MNKIERQDSAHVVGVVLLIVAMIGVLGYAGIKSYQDRQAQSKQPEQANTSVQEAETANKTKNSEDISIMMSKVAMNMPRAEVDAKIGKPYKCTAGVPVEKDKIEYKIDSCLYGSPDDESSFNIHYMNDKIWGTTYVKNP